MLIRGSTSSTAPDTPILPVSIAGDRFGGAPKLDNLVSQLSGVNLSNYKILENEWANALMEKKRVTVNVDIQYKGNSLRPDHFVIQYEIDGIKKLKRFTTQESKNEI